MLILLVLLIIPICLLEGIPLYREKKWKEVTALGVLIGLSLLIGIGKEMKLPAPLELLQRWLYPLSEALFKRF